MSLFSSGDRSKAEMPTAESALPGRENAIVVPNEHAVLGSPIMPPFAAHLEMAMFGLGCFWGAERRFWQQPGVYSTAVGYSAGFTQNPTYEEVCSGRTGHNEVVLVVFNPQEISYLQLLKVFWEAHNPTQGMRQGNDQGTQYRSGIYTFDPAQAREASASKTHYAEALQQQGMDQITTEIQSASEFYYAEDYHQQYLHKNPNGYCGLGGTGVSCSID
ncbi:MAG: peptide-methionine (S)-S-oxide reductase [Cellvibrionaceae bacterium]|nr:peptide-methionine (S)-S-oxide reductase [Cellvibrionaceae bacterium]|tara:strand:- start:20058 stop:20708 length:651 start_codon:yes stop_codon:yes gene_type:complete